MSQSSGGARLLTKAFRSRRGDLVAVALFSAMANLLLLTGPLFMLQVYDRVLASGSVPTLIALVILVTALFLLYGIFELVRGRVLARVGLLVDGAVSGLAFRKALESPIRGRDNGGKPEPTRDVDTVRQFLSGGGPNFILDMPWIPVYVAVVALLHPLLGLAVVGGAVVLGVGAVLNDRASRRRQDVVTDARVRKNAISALGQRNAEVVAAMGMGGNLTRRWSERHEEMLVAQTGAGDLTGGITAWAKTFRLMLQSGILALGAYLAILQEITPGAMIAASIISARALGPVEQALSRWRSFLETRSAWRRLDEDLTEDVEVRTTLPRPASALEVSGLAIAPPGMEKPTLTDVNFRLEAGQSMAVVGPSAAGKTTLGRALAGVWPALEGEVRLDGATLDQWTPEALGRFVGYLPQDVELFDGTVAENVSRFDERCDDDQVIAAATAAGAHELITGLPEGYDTRIGPAGANLSAGQRQRVGLARALYGMPFLVILDEPDANLDTAGEEALRTAITGAKAAGSIVVIMAHRANAIAAADHVLVLAGGRQRAFGPPSEVLPRIVRKPGAAKRSAA